MIDANEPRDGVLVVVDRRAGPLRAAAVAAFLAAVLLLALFARKRALLALFAGVRALGTLAEDVPFLAVPRGVEAGALLVVLLTPVTVWFLLARWVRRSARVEVGHDEVVLDRPLGRWLLDDRRVVVPAATIEAVEAGPTGLRLLAGSAAGPLTIVLPVLDPAEQAQVVRALDAARDPAREPGRALAGTRIVPTLPSLATITVAVLSFFACASVELVLGLPASLLLVGVWALAVSAATRRVAERHAQVVVGARRLAVADAVAAWTAVRAVALEGPWLAADLGPTAGPTRDGRRLVRLTPEARERLLPLLRERLGERLTWALPGWAARRATRGAVLAPHLAAVAAGLVGLLALPLVHDLVVWTDHRGQELRLLVRRLDGSLRRAVVCPVSPATRTTWSTTGPWSAMAGSPGGPELQRGRIEWPDGRTAPIPREAKVVVVGPGTVTCDTRLLPSLRGDVALDRLLGRDDLQDGAPLRLGEREGTAALVDVALRERSSLLEEVAEGRRGTRCEVASPPGRRSAALLWQAEEGRVTGVVLGLAGDGERADGACWCRTLDRPPFVRRDPSRLGSGLRVAASPLPTLDQLLEARARLAAGASLRQATEAWAPELWR